MIHTPVKVGYLIKAFGNSGYLRVNLDKNHLNNIQKAGYLLVDINGNNKPVFIEDYKAEEDLIKFQNINGPHEARPLSDKPVYLLNKDIISDSNPQQILNETIIGFMLYDQEDKLIGTIKELVEIPMQVLLKVTLIRNEENRLVPFHDSLLISISPENKSLQIQIADGLLDLK